jgi:hypothetical protein
MHEVGLWAVLGLYLPMLAIVLLRLRTDKTNLQQRHPEQGRLNTAT